MAAAPLFEEDGIPATKLFNQGSTNAYDDIIFLPHYIDFPTDSVQLATKLTRNLSLSIPCVASPMDTVTEASMAVSMASLGGIGIVHSNNSAIEQASLVEFAKAHRIPFVNECVFKAPNDDIVSVDEFGDSPCVFVTENGTRNSKLLGVVYKSEWEKFGTKREARVSEYMVESVVNVPSSYNFDDVAGYLAAKNLDYVPLIRNGEVFDLVSVGDVERVRGFPKTGALPSLGKYGEFLVGASIETRESDKEGLEKLVKAGADVIVLDSSQGNSIYQIDMIKYVKRTYPELELIGGNVVMMPQAQNLIQAGVDGLRVGMGSGSICTTQEVCAVGRGQVIDYIVNEL